MIHTTLNKIRACRPCASGWKKLLAHLGKTEADDELVPFSVIVEANGLDDALWWAANPEKARIYCQNRRAKKRVNGGTLSHGLEEKLCKLQRGKCACCGLPLGNDFHMDHIIPLALGGANEDWNIQLLRQRCNNQKGAKHPIAFMQQRGFLL